MPERSSRLPAWLLYVLLAVAIFLSVSTAVRRSSPYFARTWKKLAFYDFRLWRVGINNFAQTGCLYDVETPGYFAPGSRSFYKYPPTFGALLALVRTRSQAEVGRGFLIADYLLLGAAFLLMAWGLRPGRWRFLLGLCLFLSWAPLWESLSDLQMESIILCALSVTLALEARGRTRLSGLGVGLAGAFKVFPWMTALHYLARRRWRGLIAVAAGALLTFALSWLVIPPRHTVEFFFSILPRLGGTLLSYENISLLANLGRLSLALTGRLPTAEALEPMVLESSAPAGPRVMAAALALLLVAGLAIWVVRVVRRLPRISAEVDLLLFGLFTAVTVFLIPTSWTSYQALLALPALICLFRLEWPGSRWRGLPWEWLLFVAGMLPPMLLYSYDRFFARSPATFALLRSIGPVVLIVLLLRMAGRRGAPHRGHLL